MVMAAESDLDLLLLVARALESRHNLRGQIFYGDERRVQEDRGGGGGQGTSDLGASEASPCTIPAALDKIRVQYTSFLSQRSSVFHAVLCHRPNIGKGFPTIDRPFGAESRSDLRPARQPPRERQTRPRAANTSME